MQNICGSAGCSSAAPQPLLTGLALLRNHPRDHGDGLGRGWLSASTGRVELLLWVAAVTEPPHILIPTSIICLIPSGTIGFLSDGLILVLRQPFHPLGVQQQEFLQVTFGFVLL